MKRIIVFRTDRIGDLLLSTPAIHALKQAYPDAGIDIMVHSQCIDVVALNPDICEVIAYEPPKRFKEKCVFLHTLKKKHYDLAIIMNPNKMIHIMVFLAGIKIRVGYSRKCGFLLTHTIKDKKSLAQKHEIEYNIDLVSTIGVKAQEKNPIFVVSENDRKSVVSKLMSKGVDIALGKKIVAVHAGTSNKEKMWDIQKYSLLVTELAKQENTLICLIGVKGEEDIASAIGKDNNVENLIDLTGVFSLRELGAFLQNCSLLVSNDSGPAHIAASLKTATVTIFAKNVEGAKPTRWHPYGNAQVVLWDYLANITVEQVLNATKEVLH